MRHLILASFCGCVIGLSPFAIGADGPVDFTDYNNSGLRLYDAKVKASDGAYILSGRFANAQSKFTLMNAEVVIVAMDCSKSDDGSKVCFEIARHDLTIPEAIAPWTTSALNVTMHFKESPLKVTGLLEWSVWVMAAERQ